MKKAYPKYRPTNIPWIPTIPEHWEEVKFKYIFSERVQKGYPEEPLLAATQTQGVIPKEMYETRTVTAQKDFHLLKLVKEGDFVISLRSFQGGIEYAYYQGIISPAYTVLQPLDLAYGHYFKYLLKSKNFIDDLTTYVTGIREGQNINYSDLRTALSPLPPLPEQHTIAAFLDNKCALIDRFIEKKTRLIELLKEQKQAIINRAVTKGLDPEVTMKPSGVDWLGDIPAHWEVKKLKYFLKSLKGGGTPSMEKTEYWNGDIPWVSPKDMKSDYIISSEMKVTNQALSETIVNLVPKNSLLLVVRSGILQRKLPVAINGAPVTINQDLKAITPIDEISAEYLFSTLKGLENEILINCRKAVATVESIEIPLLTSFRLAIPNRTEQNKICQYIQNEAESINLIIKRLWREIDLIKEYKTTLIAEAVTGKIDVRDWQGEDKNFLSTPQNQEIV